MARPWLTLLIDAFTRRVLAVYPTFAKPSYVSCMMALRLCLQRWCRLPDTIVVDGGPEFHSTAFEMLLAWYQVMLKTRPLFSSDRPMRRAAEGYFVPIVRFASLEGVAFRRV